MSSAIHFDGEGGDPEARTALSLSLATGRPFVIEWPCAPHGARGPSPALLAYVRAAQAVSGARVEGAEAGSGRLFFEPGLLRPGRYLLDAGPSGSVAGLAQTLAVPLGLAGGVSVLKLTGLTHGREAPPIPTLSFLWLPVLRELGHDLDVELAAAGFPPEGGGEVTIAVRPARPASPVDRRSRGTLRDARVLSTASNVPFDAACRQSERALQRLREAGIYAEAENLPLRAPKSKGLCCLVFGTFERGLAGCAAFGTCDADAERTADSAAQDFVSFMRSKAAVDEELAVHLLVPLALAAGGRQGGRRVVSRIAAPRATDALLSSATVVGKFLEDVEVAVLSEPDNVEAEIRIAPREEGLVAALRATRNRD